MSQTEFHTGTLYPVQLMGGTLEDACRTTARRHNIELGEDWREEFIDKFSRWAYRNERIDEEYFIHGNNLYLVTDHEESNYEEYFMKLSPRDNCGTLAFVGQFHNGGTCFEEMLEEALDELENKKEF